MFYCKDKQLSIGKPNIWQRFSNMFTGKAKVQEFVIDELQLEVQKLDERVKLESEKIDREIVHEIATIEDAMIQTGKVFDKMIKVGDGNGK